MSEIHYTATQKIITGGTVTEITPRDAFISSSNTAHYENCSVVTRMLSGGGQNRMARRNITTAEKALAGIKTGSYDNCNACTAIAAKRADEYTSANTLITTPNNTSEEETMNDTTNTEITLPDGVKDTQSNRTIYAAMLAGASGFATEIAKASGSNLTSTKRALAALVESGAVAQVDVTVPGGTNRSSFHLSQAQTTEPEGLELLGSEEETTLIPGLGEIPNSTLNVLATGNPEMTANEKRVRDLLAKTFKTEWTALTDPQQAAIVCDFQAAEQVESEGFNVKSYRKDIGTNNLLTYANGILAADLRESMNPDFDTDDTDDDMVDADDVTETLDTGKVRTGDDTLTVEDGWETLNDDMPLDDGQDDDSDDSEEEEPQQAAPAPVKRVAKPKLKAAGVKKGEVYGYLSGTGLAHTAMCASVKAAELGTLNIPMGPEYRHPLGDLLQLVENGDIKECRLCAKLRRTLETKQVDVSKFAEFVRSMANGKREDAPLAKTFSGFVVTVSGTTKSKVAIDLRGPASNQWSRRKDIEKKNLNRAVQDLVQEVTSK